MLRHRVVPLLVGTAGLVAVVLAFVTPYAWLALVVVVGVAVGWWRRAAPPASGPRRPRPDEVPAAPVLVGRERDVAGLAAVVGAGAQLVVVAGAPGSGKSALALRFAHDARDGFPDGQLYAALWGSSADPVPPEVVLARFLRALGRPEEELRGDVVELAARFRSVVADRRVLVLLDDARDATQVRYLLPGGAGSLALVTSRRLLSDLLGAVVVRLGGLAAAAALELLAASAGAGRVAGDPVGASRLVGLCEGLPLAVRVVGGRLRARPQVSVAEVADLVAVQRRRLDAARAAVRVAYDGLPAAERLVFRLVGGYPGVSVGLGAAAARCGGDEHAVAEALERLADVFLVEVPAPERYRLHALVRVFARDVAEDGAAADERQARWLVARARPGRWLVEERENVIAVARALVEAGSAGAARALVVAVHPLVVGAAEHGYRLRLWQAGVAAAVASGDEAFRVRALRWVSHSYGLAGLVGLELPAAEQALAGAEGLGDAREIALAVWRVGDALRARDQFVEAEAALSRALELLVGLGLVADEIEVRLALGTLYNTFWRSELSVPVLARAVELLPEREASVHGWALLALAAAEKLAGAAGRAWVLVARAFGVAERLGDEVLRGCCLQERGWLHVHEDAFEAAERDFTAMVELFGRLRAGGGVGAAFGALGEVAVRRGRPAVALAAFDAGVAEYERVGLRVRMGELLLRRAMVLRELGREREAAEARTRGEVLIGDAPIHLGPVLLRRLVGPSEGH